MRDTAGLAKAPPPGGEGVLPYERPVGMCCWMGSHFHDWIEYDGAVFFNTVTQNGVAHFRIFWGKKVLHIYG